MIQHEFLRNKGIMVVTPHGPLERLDFEALAREVDPYIKESGDLRGLLIHAKSFPGWHDFGALVSHLKFVKNHERHVAKIAAATDGGILAIMPSIASHFIKAKVKHFDYDDKEGAGSVGWKTSIPKAPQPKAASTRIGAASVFGLKAAEAKTRGKEKSLVLFDMNCGSVKNRPLKQDGKPFLLEMPVMGQNVGDTVLTHRLHRDAVGQAVSLIRASLEEAETVKKRLMGLPADHEFGVGDNIVHVGGGELPEMSAALGEVREHFV